MENEIKVGDFIRTNNGIILKVIKIEFDEEANQNYYKGDEICSGCFQEMIKTHSPNLIDIIEVDDYVNGNLVDNNTYDLLINSDWKERWGETIETVVTKEQFEAISYKVERKY